MAKRGGKKAGGQTAPPSNSEDIKKDENESNEGATGENKGSESTDVVKMSRKERKQKRKQLQKANLEEKFCEMTLNAFTSGLGENKAPALKMDDLKNGEPTEPTTEPTDLKKMSPEYEKCIKDISIPVDRNEPVFESSTIWEFPFLQDYIVANFVLKSELEVDKVAEDKFMMIQIKKGSYINGNTLWAIMDVLEDYIPVRLGIQPYDGSLKVEEEDRFIIQNPKLAILRGGQTIFVNDMKNIVKISRLAFEMILKGLLTKGHVLRGRCLDEMKPEDKTWARFANELFVRGKYNDAIWAYTNALRHENPKSAQTLIDRANAYLKINCFNNANMDCILALQYDPDNKKAVYRRVRALIGLSQPVAALQFLHLKIEMVKSCEELTGLFALCKKLTVQRQVGAYNVLDMLQRRGSLMGDLVTYCGPFVIQDVPGRGRGLVATQRIEPGELILGSRAIDCVLYEQPKMVVKAGQAIMAQHTFGQLLRALALRLHHDESMWPLVADLYSGPYANPFKPGEDIHPVKLAKLLPNILYYNCISYTADTDSLDLITTPALYELCTKMRKKTLGLWYIPSFINHDCWNANCTIMVTGDFMLVRASKVIEKDEEILRCYVNQFKGLGERQDSLQKFGIHCQCDMCKWDISTNPNGVLTPNTTPNVTNLKALQKFLKNILTVKGKENINVHQFVPRKTIALHYYHNGDFLKAAKEMEKVYDMTTGTPFSTLKWQCAFLIVSSLRRCIRDSHRQEAKDIWVPRLQKALVTVFGTPEVLQYLDPNVYFALVADGCWHQW